MQMGVPLSTLTITMTESGLRLVAGSTVNAIPHFPPFSGWWLTSMAGSTHGPLFTTWWKLGCCDAAML
jgi:hypothetical protein